MKAAFVVIVLDEMVDSYLKVEVRLVILSHVVLLSRDSLCNMGT